MNMNATPSRHEANLAGWARIHDLIRALGAAIAVVAKCPPRLDSLPDDDHAACEWRLSFCNATARTAGGNGGTTSRHALLQPQPDLTAPGESAEAMLLRQTGENSFLANLATSVSESLAQVLRWLHWWNSSEETPGHVTDQPALFELSTDYDTRGMGSMGPKSLLWVSVSPTPERTGRTARQFPRTPQS